MSKSDKRYWIKFGMFGLVLLVMFSCFGCFCRQTGTLYRFPSWTPDGRIMCLLEETSWYDIIPLYFSDAKRGNVKTRTYIVVMNDDGTNERKLFEIENGSTNPLYSPSGKMISYNIPKGAYIINADGSNKRFCPSAIYDWSPDEKMAVFSSASHKIYVTNIDGTNFRTLAEGSNPAWYYGEKIVFEWNKEGKGTFYLALIDPNTGEITTLRQGGGDATI